MGDSNTGILYYLCNFPINLKLFQNKNKADPLKHSI